MFLEPLVCDPVPSSQIQTEFQVLTAPPVIGNVLTKRTVPACVCLRTNICICAFCSRVEFSLLGSLT